MIKLSMSVVCYNPPLDQLQSLIDSLVVSIKHLQRHCPSPLISIFLVDNSEGTSSLTELCSRERQRLKKYEVELKSIAGHGNIGYGRAHNLTLSLIDSDFHLILNPDVTVKEDTLFLAVDQMTKNRDIKALSPSATDSSGNKQYLCKAYPSVLTLLIRGFGPSVVKRVFSDRLSVYEMRHLSEDKPTEAMMMLGGCFLLVDTETLKAINGFDERFFLYFEDFDFSIRISKYGKLVYYPGVRITHSGGNTSSKGLWHICIFLTSAIRFFNIHGWRFL